MNAIGSILDAIKQHGVLSVLVIVMFLYFNDRITDLETKYEHCMNERINEAYRIPRASNVNKRFVIHQRPVAVLVEPTKIKRKNESA